MEPEEYQQVSNAFHRYVSNGDGDISEIEAYSREQIEFAIIKHSNFVDPKQPFYKAMQNRVATLKEKEATRKRWFERIVFMVIGSILTLLASMLIKYLS